MSLFRINWPWSEPSADELAFGTSKPPPFCWEEHAPPVGTEFEHCGATLVVIDSGYRDGCDWRNGVLCHYRDDRGQLREVFFTPAQWLGLVDAGVRIKANWALADKLARALDDKLKQRRST